MKLIMYKKSVITDMSQAFNLNRHYTALKTGHKKIISIINQVKINVCLVPKIVKKTLMPNSVKSEAVVYHNGSLTKPAKPVNLWLSVL